MKDNIKLYEALCKYKEKCKCGHTMFIRPKLDFVICHWCKNKVFSKRGSFKEHLKNKMKEVNKNEEN